jgi:hypothetical protein
MNHQSDKDYINDSINTRCSSSSSSSSSSQVLTDELTNKNLNDSLKVDMMMKSGNSLFKRIIGNDPNKRYVQVLDKFIGKRDPGYSAELKYLLKRKTELEKIIERGFSNEKEELNEINIKLKKFIL